MKTTKRIMSFVLCFIMMLGGYTTVYAQVENVGVTDSPIYLVDGSEIGLYSTKFPEDIWNLRTKGQYNFSGYIGGPGALYSNYFFTGASKVEIYVKNEGSAMIITELKKEKNGFNTIASTKTISAGNYQTWSVDTNSSDKYYLRFTYGGEFSGHIKAI